MYYHFLFADRIEAGKQLGALLQHDQYANPVVVALPRGGVIVGAEVAKALGCPLDITISRKIGHPMNPEYAIGAISEHSHVVGDRFAWDSVDQAWLTQAIEDQKTEIGRRRQRYLRGRAPIELAGKTVIIVDDGIATGSTMMTAINEVKLQSPAKIIVAVPVAPKEQASIIRKLVDEFTVISVPDGFYGAVGAYYKDFEQTSDSEVIAALDEANAGC